MVAIGSSSLSVAASRFDVSVRRNSSHRLVFNLAVDYPVFNRYIEYVPADADPLSQVFSALADPIRRDMVARLAGGDATVNQLAAPYDVTVQAVSKHLKVLEDAGLVSRRREAQRRPVHLEAEVFDLMTKWIERYRRQAEARYRRLDDVLRSMPDDVTPRPEAPEQGASR
jgi:DNA-binding transcriptional ArsR family regulator